MRRWREARAPSLLWGATSGVARQPLAPNHQPRAATRLVLHHQGRGGLVRPRRAGGKAEPAMWIKGGDAVEEGQDAVFPITADHDWVWEGTSAAFNIRGDRPYGGEITANLAVRCHGCPLVWLTDPQFTTISVTLRPTAPPIRRARHGPPVSGGQHGHVQRRNVQRRRVHRSRRTGPLTEPFGTLRRSWRHVPPGRLGLVLTAPAPVRALAQRPSRDGPAPSRSPTTKQRSVRPGPLPSPWPI